MRKVTHGALRVHLRGGREHAGLRAVVVVLLAAGPDAASSAAGEDVRRGEEVGVVLADWAFLHRGQRAVVHVGVNGHDPGRFRRGEQRERAVVHNRVGERYGLVWAREPVVDRCWRRGGGRRGRRSTRPLFGCCHAHDWRGDRRWSRGRRGGRSVDIRRSEGVGLLKRLLDRLLDG